MSSRPLDPRASHPRTPRRFRSRRHAQPGLSVEGCTKLCGAHHPIVPDDLDVTVWLCYLHIDKSVGTGRGSHMLEDIIQDPDLDEFRTTYKAGETVVLEGDSL